MWAHGKTLEGPAQVKGHRRISFRSEAASGARAHSFAPSDPKAGEGGNLWHLAPLQLQQWPGGLHWDQDKPTKLPPMNWFFGECVAVPFLKSFSRVQCLDHQHPGLLLEMQIPGFPQIQLTRNSGSGAQQSLPLQAILVQPKVWGFICSVVVSPRCTRWSPGKLFRLLMAESHPQRFFALLLPGSAVWGVRRHGWLEVVVLLAASGGDRIPIPSSVSPRDA